MDFMTAVSSVLSKYVGFQGRARRSEYWWWALASFLIALVAEVLDRFIDPPAPGMFSFGLIYSLVALGLFLPSLAVGVRRLHDTDRSGFWFFIALVPFVGAILLLVWFCMKGTSGSNRFGPDPVT